MNSYDIDGVLLINGELVLRPAYVTDVIITGRSFEEESETLKFLDSCDVMNEVIFNPIPWKEKTRVLSGIHKGNTIVKYMEKGYRINRHYEDDEVQKVEIERIVYSRFPTTKFKVILVNSDEYKENTFLGRRDTI